jgi:hypothetical protein
LFVGLLGLGLGVGVGREAFDGLAKTYGSAAGEFCLEGVEAARDVQVLRYVRRGNALAEVLEAAARGLGILAGERLDLGGDRSVVTQDVARRTVLHVSVGWVPAIM